MNNLIKILFILIALNCYQFSYGKSQTDLFLNSLIKNLDNASYSNEILELNKKGIPYILTESIWANSSRNIYAVILLPESTSLKPIGINDIIYNKDSNNFKKRIQNLIKKIDKLPKKVISGVDLVKNARRSLPFVLTRISIYDGKHQYNILSNEIALIWNLDNKKMETNNNIKYINDFLRDYIDILLDYNASKMLDIFFPKINTDIVYY